MTKKIGIIGIVLISLFNRTLAQINSAVGESIGVLKEQVKDTNYSGNFETDLYTGTVNINIPLETLQNNSMPLAIGLQYDGTGVLVNKVSGIVGQNWDLNAGGFIYRKIKGFAFDELNYNHGSQPGIGGGPSHQTGFFEARILLNRSDWKDVAHMQRILTRAIAPSPLGPLNGGPPYYEYDFGDGLPNFKKVLRIDTEPDIFHFNFFGKSGYFFMGEDGQWKVSSNHNLKVIYNEQTDLINPVSGIRFQIPQIEMSEVYKRKSIGRLTLIDDHGTKYIFGDNDVKSMEIILGGYYNTELFNPYVAKWNLKKVVDSNGVTLYDFTYKTGQYFLTNLFVEARHEISSTESNTALSFNSNPQTYSGFHRIYRENGDLYKPSYLSHIVCNNGTTVDFSYIEKDNIQYNKSQNDLLENNAAGSYYFPLFNQKWIHEGLNNIYTDEIPNSQGAFQRSIRYVLDEMKVNFNDKLVKKISFQYSPSGPRVFLYSLIKNNDEKYQFFYNYPDSLPGYLSEKKDMWGYYNGQPTSVAYAAKYNFWQDFENQKYSTRTTVTSKILNGSLSQIVWPTGGITNFIFEPHSFRKRVTNQKSINGAVLTEAFAHGGGGLRIKKIISEGKEREFFYNNSFDEMDQNISSGILLHEPLFFLRHPVYDVQMGNITGNLISSGATSSGDGINPKSDFFNSNVAYSTVFEKVNNGYIKYGFNDFDDYPDYYMEERLRPFNKLSKKIDHSFERGRLKSKVYFDSALNMILLKNYIYKNTSNNLRSKGLEYNYFVGNYQESVESDPWGMYGSGSNCIGCHSKMDPYYIYYADQVLDKELTTEYFKDGRKIESLKMYYYQSPLDLSYSMIDKIEEYPNKFDLSKFKTTKFQYAVDFGTSDPPFTYLQEKNMVGIPLSVTKYNEQQQPIARTETIYAKNSATNNLVLPISKRNIKTGMAGYGEDSFVNTKVTYDLYDVNGRLLQYTDESGLPTTIIYGYNRSQPIAIIVGATYNYVEANINLTTLQDASDSDVDDASENLLIAQLDDLRKNIAFKNFYITTYTYNPLIGITSLTNPDGIREYYKYDTQNKLEKVVDVDGKPIEEYKYNYKD